MNDKSDIGSFAIEVDCPWCGGPAQISAFPRSGSGTDMGEALSCADCDVTVEVAGSNPGARTAQLERRSMARGRTAAGAVAA